MPKRKITRDKAHKPKVAKEDNAVNDPEKVEIKTKETPEVLRDADNEAQDWIRSESYLLYSPSSVEASTKIAAFDVDGTLIVTKSGKKFPKTWDDFKLNLDEIPEKLKSLKSEGYKLVLFTNQGGFSGGYVKENDFKKKMMSLFEKLGVTMQIFIATDKSLIYRKPNTGLFELLQNKYNSDVKIDLSESFYVGDAAGRPADWAPTKKKDFSCSDRLFALNCGLKFHTPEEYFLNEKPAPYDLPSYNPSSAVDSDSPLTIKYDNDQKTTSSLSDVLPSDSSEPALIIMVGSPGSGKSHFCRTHLEPLGYTAINRDTLKTWQKCVAETERLLSENKKVVIDNTNPDKISRERYVSCAQKLGVKHVLCVVLEVDMDKSRHNGKFRQLTDGDHEPVSDMVFRIHGSKYQEPSMEEKFTTLCKVVPALSFVSEEEKSLYKRYLNDK